MDPTRESFWSSKTMQLLVFCILAIIILILVGVAVKVAFDQDVFTLVGAGIMAITGQSGAGTWRNVQVDGPQRQMAMQAAVTAPSGTLQPTVPIGSDASAAAPVPQQGYVMPSPPPPP